MSAPVDLAVIIPAYKARFFRDALECLATQTWQRFRVYVGDDAGEPALREICDTYRNRVDLVYHRFEQNLGGVDLVGHWNRCVALSAGEPWLWLFSDDDLCDPGAVEAFYRTIEAAPGYDVYRWDTTVRDEQGSVLRESPPAPSRETGCEFALSRLMLERRSFVVDYVFSRRAYDREGGFVSFPHAWFADDASWLAFSRATGICGIPGPRIHWRLSTSNVSGTFRPDLAIGKAHALFQYHAWLQTYVSEATHEPRTVREAIGQNQSAWFYHQLGVAGCYRKPSLALALMRPGSEALGVGRWRFGVALFANILRYSARRLRRWLQNPLRR
ncbi:MAG: glycosyltransferase family 2 protein [Verrucomicrobia bacterium]|nr:glycosyltransferase family 2 protein [Kiritimatiellia bacterium]MCP5489101.1 glycosyltransferase family 2 protein [Verrucomicrobiota bacterium]